MKKLLIFPFTKDLCPLVRYRDMLDEYELISAIPEKGFGWEGKDVCELDGGMPAGFILGGSFADKLKQCDTVLLNDSGLKTDGSEYSEYKALINNAGKELLTIPKNAFTEFQTDIFGEKLKNIPVPVIAVMGLGENCQKFEIQLGLRKAFESKGYKVLQFGTKAYSNMFGFAALPALPELPLWKKVYLYNRLFADKYNQEQPDVMIIGVPGGIMPFDSCNHNMFGETALSISYAANPDIAMLSYYFNIPTEEYFDLYRQFMRYRLGINTVFFHSSNTNAYEDINREEMVYLTLESIYVLGELDKQTKDLSPLLFNALIPKSCERIYQNVIEELQQNIEVL